MFRVSSKSTKNVWLAIKFHKKYTNKKEILAHVILDQAQERFKLGQMICTTLESHGDERQTHVNHDLGVVGVERTGQRYQEPQELTDTGDAVWGQHDFGFTG